MYRCMDPFFSKLVELMHDHPTLVLATVVSKDGSAPREAGARMAVMPDGSIHGTVGGGILEKTVIDDALAVMREGKPRLARYDLTDQQGGGIGAGCGGRSEVFLEPIGSVPHLLVVGAGHVGLALARLAAQTGFMVTVADDRPQFAREAAGPGVTVLELSPEDPALVDLVTPSTAVVVVTRSHQMDREALASVVDAGAFYVGMIGSRRKVAAERKALLAQGVDEASLARVFAPIGLDIAAETPAEIAVSILAEIVAVQNV